MVWKEPASSPCSLSQRTIYSGTTGGGVATRHRWIGFRAARAPVSYNFGGTVDHWMDGCWDEATGYMGAEAWHVDYAQNGMSCTQIMASPLTRLAGLAPVTMKPKKRLPLASTALFSTRAPSTVSLVLVRSV